MQEDEIKLLDLAISSRLLTRKQADVIREEMHMFKGERVVNLLLRHHYLTEDQLLDLRNQIPTAVSEEIAPPTVEQRRAAAAAAAAQPVFEPIVTPEVTLPSRGPIPRELTEQEKELAAQAQAPITSHPKTLVGFLRLARHWGCSDLHFSVGRPPFVRLNGQIRYMETDVLTAEKSEELNFSGLLAEQRQSALEHQQLDFALEIPGVGRHRCNIFKQRLGWDGSYRIVRSGIPTLEELGLPSTLHRFTEFQQGLVMVTGPSNSGKTTTCAAMLGIVNDSRKDHIITVEEPVEYVLTPKNCQITQREVGRHTNSFAAALRAALREDPDIILVGELRDLETTSIAISAAETGHLVFGTLHTGSAIRTVARIVDVYPVNQQQQVSVMVAESLRGVITQQLVPRMDGNGLIMALEVLVNTTGVSMQIKEAKSHLIPSLMQAGKRQGMMMMEDSLLTLYKSNMISGREAYRRANNKQPFEAMKEEG
ncbi:MAG: PilT/PilU family type 4a pilus ATPase [Candidatus Sumerlaeota bacterium]